MVNPMPPLGDFGLFFRLPGKVRDLVAKAKNGVPLDEGDDLEDLLTLVGFATIGKIVDDGMDSVRDGNYQALADAVVDVIQEFKPLLPTGKATAPEGVRFAAQPRDWAAELVALVPEELLNEQPMQTADPAAPAEFNPAWIPIGIQIVKLLLEWRRSRR